jgi:hypothetical protein
MREEEASRCCPERGTAQKERKTGKSFPQYVPLHKL